MTRCILLQPRLLVVLGCLVCPMAQAALGVILETNAVNTFLFPATGPIVPIIDADSSSGTGSIQSNSYQTLPIGSFGGFAYANGSFTNGQASFGTSALARSVGPFTGSAKATLHAEYDVEVVITGPSDLIGQAIFNNTVLLPCILGCVLNTSFLHTTHGQLAYSAHSADERAEFKETLSVTGSTGVTVGGTVAVGKMAPGSVGLLSVTGDWSQQNLKAFGPTPSGQLALFPTGDIRNDDPNTFGALSKFEFNHIALIEDQPAIFRAVPFTNTAGALTGTYRLTLDQSATVGPGTSYIDSTLAVDFADTSTFAFYRIVDPGGVDLSDYTVSMAFVSSVSSVPEPSPWMLWAAAVPIMLMMGRRGRLSLISERA